MLGRQPPRRRKPAAVADRQPCCARPPRTDPAEQLVHVLTAAGSPTHQVKAPVIDLGPRNVGPRLAVPVAEVHLDQQRVDAVHPAPGRQHATDVCAASKW